MDVRYFKRVFYRTAASIITTATKGGAYPNFTISGWTVLPGNVVGATINPDAEKDEAADGGSTNRVVAEKSVCEITISEFTTAEFNTLRGLQNQKLDILIMDPDQPAVCMAVFGVRVKVKPEFQTTETPKLIISGERKYGADIATQPFQLVQVS